MKMEREDAERRRGKEEGRKMRGEKAELGALSPIFSHRTAPSSAGLLLWYVPCVPM